MQAPSTTRAGQRSSVPLDFDSAVSKRVVRRVRELVEQTTVWSVDGMDLVQYGAYRRAGVRLPLPTLVRGSVGTPPRRHRVQLETDAHGVPLGSCDCEASRWGRPCSHLWALAVHAVALGWRSA